MPRHIYLGEKLSIGRAVVKPPEGPVEFVFPSLSVFDPNAEPLSVVVTIPVYDATFHPLREVHLFALPAEMPIPSPEELLTGSFPHRVSRDVSNLDGPLMFDFPGLPDGAWVIQSVLVAGRD